MLQVDRLFFMGCRRSFNSQPAAVSILDGPSENNGHVAYFHADAFTWVQIKFTPTNGQVVNFQTGEWRHIKRNIRVVRPSANEFRLLNVCVCVSSYLSRPYVMLPIKSKVFSPFKLGYLACWNAASITLVVFSFTANSTQKDLRAMTDAYRHSGEPQFHFLKHIEATLEPVNQGKLFNSETIEPSQQKQTSLFCTYIDTSQKISVCSVCFICDFLCFKPHQPLFHQQ